MKKTILTIAAFVVLILSVSANTDRVYNAAEGIKAPAIEVEAADGSSVSLSDFAGRYVLLNFWASTDAESRIAANRYDAMLASHEDEPICLLSVNFDSSERLFREIVRRDNLEAESQFNVKAQSASDVIRKYGLSRGMQSFLINPEGVIVAVNPDELTLSKVLGS